MQRILHCLPFIVAVLLVMAPAIVNGFPLIYPDSVGYLVDGVRLATDLPRAMGYALLLRPFVQIGSLWPAILVQALVTTWAIRILWLRFGGLRESTDLLLLIGPLAILSPLSWTASWVLPDIFTAMVILSLAGLVAAHLTEPPVRDWPLMLLAIISSAMHASNILLLVMLSAAILGVTGLFTIWKPTCRRALLGLAGSVVAVVVIAVSANLAINAAIHRKLSITAPYGFGFALAAFNQGGLLVPFLETHCAEETYRLCEFKDALPRTSDEFLWSSPTSPQALLALLGGFKGIDSEARRIVIGIIVSRPAAVTAYMWHNLISQFSQLDIREEMPATDQDAVVSLQFLSLLKEYSIGGLQDYGDALQHYPHFPSFMLVSIQRYVTIGSLVIILCLLAFGSSRLSRDQIFGSMTILVGIVLNDLISATISEPTSRYQTRVIWLLPALVIVFAVSLGRRADHSAR